MKAKKICEGFEIQRKEDGHWLLFKAKGKHAGICVENMTFGTAVVGWIDEQLDDEMNTPKPSIGAFDTQVGGDNYKKMAIQPAEYCQKNGLHFMESCVIKYVSRHRTKNGKQDIDKAIHFLEMLKEMEYPDLLDEMVKDKKDNNPPIPNSVEKLNLSYDKCTCVLCSGGGMCGAEYRRKHHDD